MLPYRTCGNSGILADFVTSYCVPVVSNIKAFINSPYALDECIMNIDNNDCDIVLRKLAGGGAHMLNEFREQLKDKVEIEKTKFEKSVRDAYREMFNDFYSGGAQDDNN